MNHVDFDYLRLHLIVFLTGLTPSAVKMIDLPFVEIVFYRTLLTVLLLALYIAYRRYPFRYPRAAVFKMIGSGALLSLFWVFYTLSVQTSTASVAAVGAATTTLWITLLEPLIFKRKTKAFQGLMALNAVFGIYIIYNSDFAYNEGFAFGIAAGFFGALLTIQSSLFSKKSYNSFSITFYQMLGACIGTGLFIPIYVYLLPNLSGGNFAYQMTWKDFLLILFLVITLSIYAWAMLIRVMKKIAPFTVALVNNLTPIYAIMIAILFFSQAELMNLGFYVGTLLLLISVFAYPLLRHHAKQS
ncbi:MAG: DMT family transporter [Bernardetiaceae bacterium]